MDQAMSHPTKNVVGAFDAKNNLGQLLDQVARGEVIVITRCCQVQTRRDRVLSHHDDPTLATFAVDEGGREFVPGDRLADALGVWPVSASDDRDDVGHVSGAVRSRAP